MSATKSERVECLLCRKLQSWDGYGDHLTGVHGVLEGIDFLVEVSRQKQRLGTPQNHQSSQTGKQGDKCGKCGDLLEERLRKNKSKKRESTTTPSIVMTWQCPLCPRIFSQYYHFDLHLTSHGPVTLPEIKPVQMSRIEFEEKKKSSDLYKMFSKEKSYQGSVCDVKPPTQNFISLKRSSDGQWQSKSIAKNKPTFPVGLKRKTDGEKWSSAANYPCKFCGNIFAHEFNLRAHIALAHQDEPSKELVDAQDEVDDMKLEGCIYQCKPCGNKFTVASCFSRHIKDHHSLNIKQYRAEYGESEIVSKQFKCRLCQANIKHTRNNILRHLTQVHLVSWKEYLEMYLKKEPVTQLPSVKHFQCKLCGAAVNLRKQHLVKFHKMDEDVYIAIFETEIQKLESRSIVTCGLCARDCIDLARHLRLCHNSMGKKEYDREVQGRPVDETDTKEDEPKLNCPSPHCKLQFDKDHRLLFHVRIEHRDGDPEENNLLWEKAKNVITLNKRSAASLECAVCNYVLDSRGSFWSHVTKRHGIPWEQYLEQHGMPERKMWQCRICGFETEHDRAKLSHHLKTSHSLSWQEYQKKVHNIKEEDIPAPLPEMKHNLEEYNQRRKDSSVDGNKEKLEEDLED